MKALSDIFMTLLVSAVVTAAVVLGFTGGNALGVPVWLQGIFLLPAALLFFWLSGTSRPPILKLVGFFGLLSVFVLLVHLG